MCAFRTAYVHHQRAPISAHLHALNHRIHRVRRRHAVSQGQSAASEAPPDWLLEGRVDRPGCLYIMKKIGEMN